MEEIRIYRIVWKNILAAIVCLALTAFGIIESSKNLDSYFLSLVSTKNGRV